MVVEIFQAGLLTWREGALKEKGVYHCSNHVKPCVTSQVK